MWKTIQSKHSGWTWAQYQGNIVLNARHVPSRPLHVTSLQDPFTSRPYKTPFYFYYCVPRKIPRGILFQIHVEYLPSSRPLVSAHCSLRHRVEDYVSLQWVWQNAGERVGKINFEADQDDMQAWDIESRGATFEVIIRISAGPWHIVTRSLKYMLLLVV